MSTNANASGPTTGVALVTGASHGIGLEVCRQLAERGFTVLLTAREADKAEAAAKELRDAGLGVQGRALDVLDDASVHNLVDAVRGEFRRLDVLVNNAAAPADWAEMASSANLEAAHAAFETNLFGTWRVTQAFLPLIKESAHGRIVFVSSGAGSHGDPQFGLMTNGGATASYGISKAAINALMTKFATELADTPLRVNAVCPGLTATAPGMEAMGARPVPEGAASVVWATVLPDSGPTGGFFRDGKPLPW